ncbi:MAG: Bacillosamine/Legionaminic acid biosynthesis aminotransferase PglE; 4-keto-6-deoxy-N-Acetyl-D-hexosaminyl-(Lipid carrier) aminotransferase, partial [uncultured Caballeronia sp.]
MAQRAQICVGLISSVGKYIGAFEETFATFCGVKHAIATNNGTTALHLALVALNLQPGDEMIIPTVTYITTANAERYCGAKPVLVDVQADTMNIDLAEIEKSLADRALLASWYAEALAGLEDQIILPKGSAWIKQVHWMYNIFLREGDAACRDAVMRNFDQVGIETRLVFLPDACPPAIQRHVSGRRIAGPAQFPRDRDRTSEADDCEAA